jgi:hypothetical protein
MKLGSEPALQIDLAAAVIAVLALVDPRRPISFLEEHA